DGRGGGVGASWRCVRSGRRPGSELLGRPVMPVRTDSVDCGRDDQRRESSYQYEVGETTAACHPVPRPDRDEEPHDREGSRVRGTSASARAAAPSDPCMEAAYTIQEVEQS